MGRFRPCRDRSAKGVTGRESACKIIHPVNTWLNSGKNSGIFGDFLRGLPAGQFRAPAGINQALCGGCIFPDYPPAKPRQACIRLPLKYRCLLRNNEFLHRYSAIRTGLRAGNALNGRAHGRSGVQAAD